MNPSRRRWMSLRVKLPLLLSTLLIVVVSAMCLFGYRQIEQVLTDATSSRLTGLTQRLNTTLTESVRRMGTDLRKFARDSLFVHYLEHPDSLSAERARGVLNKARAGQSLALSLVRRDGTGTVYVGSQLKVHNGDQPAGIPVEQLPEAATDTAVIGPLQATDEGVVYRIRVPVVRNDVDTVGYFSLYRTLGTGQAAGLLNELIGSNASLMFGNVNGHLWTDLSKVVGGPPTPVIAGEFTEYSDASGKQLMGVGTPVGGTRWLAWVQVPRTAALQPARTFLTGMASISLLVVLIAAGIAALVSSRATLPLAEVSRAAEDLAKGQYDRRVAVVRHDEIGSLAESFNSMASRIEGNNQELLKNAAALRTVNVELTEGERRYRSLVELLPDAVLVHRKNRVVFANPAALPLFGAERMSDVIGRDMADFVPLQGDGPAVNGASFAPNPSPRALQVRRLNGNMVRVESSTIPFTHEGHAAELLILRDVSERDRLETRIRQAQKMEAVGQLAGGVAHDFNNLLTVVTSYSSMLLTELPADNQMRADVQEIANAADRAATLTRQLLAFSRQQVLEPRVLEVNAIVSGMEKMLRRVIPTNISLETNFDDGAGRVCADPGQLEQVLMNLCVNARDAMLDGGTLQIQTSNIVIDENSLPMHAQAAPGAYVVLTVSDTGVGMTPAQQARIFDPFFTTKAPGKGTGLGLSTVYGIVQQSGGYIWVYSEVGHGTVFRVYLPRVDQPVAVDIADNSSASLRGNETILLVEDEAPVRVAARRILESAGYHVLDVSSGAEALRRSADFEGNIHILLTDMVMPEMSGRDISQRFRQLRPGAPTIYMSGYTEDTVLRQSVAESGSYFLQKPFTPRTLMQKIRSTLDRN